MSIVFVHFWWNRYEQFDFFVQWKSVLDISKVLWFAGSMLCVAQNSETNETMSDFIPMARRKSRTWNFSSRLLEVPFFGKVISQKWQMSPQASLLHEYQMEVTTVVIRKLSSLWHVQPLKVPACRKLAFCSVTATPKSVARWWHLRLEHQGRMIPDRRGPH